jgi:hypothetical protein
VNRLAAGLVAPSVPEAVRPGDSGVVVGAGSSAAYVDFQGFVVAITAARVPAMSNGISLASSAGIEQIRPGADATVRATGMQLDGAFVDWSDARRATVRVSSNPDTAPDRIADRGRDLLPFAGTLGRDADGNVAVAALGEAFVEGNTHRAADAAMSLLGRGRGLTPEGDDVLAGCAAAIVAFGKPLRLSPVEKERWLSALCPPDVRVRTTALSATLLELACDGCVAEPLVTLLDLAGDVEQRRRAARALMRVGHSTGRAWMAGCGIATTGLAAGYDVAGDANPA